MFITYFIGTVLFGILASVDDSLFVIWFLCALGCFILGLIDLIKGGYNK